MTTLWWLLIGSWMVGALVLLRTTRREKAAPLDNLPVIFILIALLYTTLPPLWWILRGQWYSSVRSGRLFALQPLAEDQVYLTSLGLLMVLGVGVMQLLLSRRRASVSVPLPVRISGAVVTISIVIVVANLVFNSALQALGVIRTAIDYVDSYLVIQELPLWLRQGLKIVGGLSQFSKLVVLVWLFQNWRSHKWWIALLVGFSAATIDPSAGRASLFVLLFACLILWNRYVRPVSLTQLALAGVSGVVFFTILGMLRGGAELNSSDGAMLEMGVGEFDVIWANALTLLHEREMFGLRVPLSLHFSEWYGPIPSNVLPFEKLSYSIWFLDEYYPEYRLQGGGMMFGMLAQLVIGGGASEAIVRGLALGLALWWLTDRLRRGRAWWCYPALLYLSVWMFSSVRDSSFALVTPLVQVVLVAVVLTGAIALPFGGTETETTPRASGT